eukprot:CAMPEP_0197484654 /NCGR_PEP_ID=MMETSP1309-20131121/57514_1 /TAXON_ID=464262 /ORGANISM="Genus nov. species nov., Strain RCC998" /LENGTH=204 /DNA_ID=CAMNT_0043027297 /DNA_START=469 /DNA_END=1084 /DNA_ORIENTATION=+
MVEQIYEDCRCRDPVLVHHSSSPKHETNCFLVSEEDLVLLIFQLESPVSQPLESSQRLLEVNTLLLAHALEHPRAHSRGQHCNLLVGSALLLILLLPGRVDPVAKHQTQLVATEDGQLLEPPSASSSLSAQQNLSASGSFARQTLTPFSSATLKASDQTPAPSSGFGNETVGKSASGLSWDGTTTNGSNPKYSNILVTYGEPTP